jgi:hypothetical protein
VKLPKLSAGEIHALRAPGNDVSRRLAERIKVHLAASLSPRTHVEVRVHSTPVRIKGGVAPHMHADDELLAAWVGARYGSAGVNLAVPAYLCASLLAKVRQALAEVVLRDELGEASSLCLEIAMNGQHGKLELDWSDMSVSEFKGWAVEQWAAR